MDLVGACLAFVHVSDHAGFTPGAAAAGIPQPVASRRVAALEEHLGGRLFDRSTRRAVLTQFGRDMLPAARRLLQAAEELQHDAARAALRPLRLAVPDTCTPLDLALLGARAREAGVAADPVPAAPAARRTLLRDRDVRAALLAVPSAEADWTVPLGAAATEGPATGTLHLETLRLGRTDLGTRPRRLWLQPEDDVPHIRDPLTRMRDALGLRPTQVATAPSLAAAATEVLAGADLLLCSPAQADELDLYWRPLGGTDLARGYDLAAGTGDEAERLRHLLDRDIARCLGSPGGPR
ncbi:LysR family transcriptional regulator [Nocardiopsis algeriensis]|uniref:DNA-binding transcriptional LysR family regulator n=1 Tax=Nocardiopsis algeriensis TaxID=1478215 RepID=A0A841IUV5_9ACTN|nr:LysR family transcriptional regulator [Nocardiopsis algeriensis]MBB6122114.1 DNA-binding transcriptional LysR family regulator [Nocardiopsis algeriensis]